MMHPLVAEHLPRIAEKHGVTGAAILARFRTREVTRARHELLFEIWLDTECFSETARILGMDHSTVMSAVRKVQAEAEAKRSLRVRVCRRGEPTEMCKPVQLKLAM